MCHFCNKGSAEKLEKVNERAVRFVLGDKHITYSCMKNFLSF